ncbi:MAG: hypothetical protein ACYST5_07225 [Planctomycetota bacterium]|jgi:hypothetical protein
MEPENSENWSQPYKGQTEPSTPQQPEKKTFFQQERLQQTWLNVKLATWLKCLIIIAALSITAALVAPKFTTAQSQQQETSTYYSEFQEDWDEDCEEEWYDDSEDWYGDCYDD